MQKRREKGKGLKAEILLIACALLALIMVSTACQDDAVQAPPAPNSAEKNSKKANNKQADNSIGSAAEQRDYSYNPNGKVDPFVPLITNSPSTESIATETRAEKKDIPLSPLQKLDIDDFTLVAVITTDSQLTALLEDPAMNGFIVTEGMLIGRNEGVIRKILPGSLIVEEQSTDVQGNKEMKIKTITLTKK